MNQNANVIQTAPIAWRTTPRMVQRSCRGTADVINPNAIIDEKRKPATGKTATQTIINKTSMPRFLSDPSGDWIAGIKLGTTKLVMTSAAGQYD
jgi:hypothetical protein